MRTKRNLHSHDHKAPVSGRQEVSGFGEDGEGDFSDNWFIEWKDGIKGDAITGSTLFYLKHEDTDKYLYTDKRSMFNQQNCRNWPIQGQAEISGNKKKSKNALWKFQFYAAVDIDDDFLFDEGMGDIDLDDDEWDKYWDDDHTDDL